MNTTCSNFSLDKLMESSEHDNENNGFGMDISINSDAGVESCLQRILDYPSSPQLRPMKLLLPRPCMVDTADKEDVCNLVDGSLDEKKVLLTGAFTKTTRDILSEDMTNTDDSEPEIESNTSPTGSDSTSPGFRDSPTDQYDQQSDEDLGPRLPESPGIRSAFQAPYRPPTKLHELCAQAQTALDLKQARSTLLQLHLPRKGVLNFTRTQDGQGRTPLHLLSENKGISESLDDNTKTNFEVDDGLGLFPDLVSKVSYEDDHRSREMIVESFVLDFVYKANPSASMARDNEGTFFWRTRISYVNALPRFPISRHIFCFLVSGRIPFELAIAEWVNECYDDMIHGGNTSNNRRGSITRAPQAVLAAVRHSISRSVRRTEAIIKSPDVERGRGTLGLTMMNQNHPAPSSGRKDKSVEWMARKKCFPVHVRLSSHVLFALKMLSAILERLDNNLSSTSSTKRKSRAKTPTGLAEADSFDRVIQEGAYLSSANKEIQEAIVSSVASIPDVAKLVFLLEDEDRELALSMTIIRRVLMNKHSVGNWLPAMLQSGNRRVSDAAVYHLLFVSQILASNDTTMSFSRPRSDLSKALLNQNEIANELSFLPNFVPALMALGDKKMAEAATSVVVQRVMDRLISRPFAVLFILCDAAFLVLLIFGFRLAVNNLLVHGSPNTVMQGVYIANTGIFYFIVREIGKVVGLRMVTHRAWDYLFSFWNLADMLATTFALISVISIRSISRSEEGLDIIAMTSFRSFLAITTGLLWLRVLNMLKVRIT
jgi:hypothetical protein